MYNSLNGDPVYASGVAFVDVITEANGVKGGGGRGEGLLRSCFFGRLRLGFSSLSCTFPRGSINNESCCMSSRGQVGCSVVVVALFLVT